MPESTITRDYVPGTISRVAELHSVYYHTHWKAKVATELSDFLKRYDATRDCFWTVSAHGRIEGFIAIDGIHAESEGAHLRWFILSDTLQGQGVGNQLIDTAIAFCKHRGYHRIYLWTFEGLHAARHLYEKAGFRRVEEHRGIQWGTEVNEQRFECPLKDRP